jgi:hypothetical protein
MTTQRRKVREILELFMDEPPRWPSLWPLSPEEQRNLFITFVGGLGSIVVGACIIGIAIAFDRLEYRMGATPFTLMLATLLGAPLLAFGVFLRFAEKGSRFVRICFPLYVMAAVLFILAWIGIAAGVK